MYTKSNKSFFKIQRVNNSGHTAPIMHKSNLTKILYGQVHSVKVPIAANKKEFVYKIKVNPTHTILKYGDYHDFMDR